MTGNNTRYNPSGTGSSTGSSNIAGPVAMRPNTPQPEDTLRWSNGQPVQAALLQRLVGLPSVWSAHDVIWSQQ